MEKYRPTSVVEFGGGRSTLNLADFVLSNDGSLVTFEENPNWVFKVRRDLKGANVAKNSKVIFCEKKDDWYDLDVVDKHFPSTLDLLFIDGPAGDRSSPKGQDYLIHKVHSLSPQIVIIDDTHRTENSSLAEQIRRLHQYKHFRYSYKINALDILVLPNNVCPDEILQFALNQQDYDILS